MFQRIQQGLGFTHLIGIIVLTGSVSCPRERAPDFRIARPCFPAAQVQALGSDGQQRGPRGPNPQAGGRFSAIQARGGFERLSRLPGRHRSQRQRRPSLIEARPGVLRIRGGRARERLLGIQNTVEAS